MGYKKIDANQNQVVKQLRQLGFSVRITSMVGKGFPDLVVGLNGKTVLVELKDENKPPSARKLTPDEIEFFDNWKGKAIVAHNIEEIVKHF